jgi:hypothetical protein
MQAQQSISVLESLIAITGNPEMPLNQAISALRALSTQAVAVAPAPVLRAPVVSQASITEAVDHANLIEQAQQAALEAQAAAIMADEMKVEPETRAIAQPPVAAKKKRGRPRKNKG